MKLTTHLRLVSRLRMSRAISLLPVCDFTESIGTTLHFSTFILLPLWLVLNATVSTIIAVTMVTAVHSSTSASLHLSCSCIYHSVTADCGKLNSDCLGWPPRHDVYVKFNFKKLSLPFPQTNQPTMKSQS